MPFVSCFSPDNFESLFLPTGLMSSEGRYECVRAAVCYTTTFPKSTLSEISISEPHATTNVSLEESFFQHT